LSDVYPTVGLAGSFIVDAPFNTLINPQLRYECVAVQSIKGLVAKGEDPLEDIYIKRSLGIGKYNIDFADNVMILTLQAATGDLLRIPSSFVLSLPDPNGIPYVCKMLGISLSAIPMTLDLDIIKQELSDMIFNTIGIRSEIKEVRYGASTLLSQTEHASIESARRNNITNNDSNARRVNELNEIILRQSQRLAMLENYIENQFN